MHACRDRKMPASLQMLVFWQTLGLCSIGSRVYVCPWVEKGRVVNG